MKAITILAALMLGTAANAFPAHQQDGYRDTGCDEAARVEIRNDAGDLLYTNNPTCPDKGGAGLSEFFTPAPEADEVAEPVPPVKVKPKA
jgi:hypothetical protein